MFPKPAILRSLRFNVFLVFLVVIFSPLLFILFSAWWESGVAQRMANNVEDAARDTRDALAGLDLATVQGRQDAQALVDGIAADDLVRIRLVDRSGAVIVDSDFEHGGAFWGLWYRLGGWAFGPDGAPSLRDFDATLDPIADRPELLSAWSTGTESGCRYSPGRKLRVCHYVAKLEGAAPIMVYVQESTRRAIRALYDLRYQYVKLTLYMLALGLGLAGWMVHTIVKPVQSLRAEVLHQAAGAAPASGFKVDSVDEVGALAEAFNTLLRALAERNKQNEEVARDLAHELKNPVSAIRSCAETLAGSRALDPERAQRIARILNDSSARLDALVSEMLELARAEAGLSNERRQSVDLVGLVRGVATAVAEHYPTCAIDVSVGDQQLFVTGVEHHLEMVIRNLIENAASFAGEAGRARVRLEKADDHARIIVEDNGPGISPEHLPRVFERFFTTRGHRQGTGLGLALTRAIVEAHEGRISVASPHGQGARFTVELPIREFT